MSGRREEDGEGGHGGEGGVPKICQGISFSKHRMLETLQERGVWTHTSLASDPGYYTENTHKWNFDSGRPLIG